MESSAQTGSDSDEQTHHSHGSPWTRLPTRRSHGSPWTCLPGAQLVGDGGLGALHLVPRLQPALLLAGSSRVGHGSDSSAGLSRVSHGSDLSVCPHRRSPPVPRSLPRQPSTLPCCLPTTPGSPPPARYCPSPPTRHCWIRLTAPFLSCTYHTNSPY